MLCLSLDIFGVLVLRKTWVCKPNVLAQSINEDQANVRFVSL